MIIGWYLSDSSSVPTCQTQHKKQSHELGNRIILHSLSLCHVPADPPKFLACRRLFYCVAEQKPRCSTERSLGTIRCRTQRRTDPAPHVDSACESGIDGHCFYRTQHHRPRKAHRRWMRNAAELCHAASTQPWNFWRINDTS